MNSSGMLGGACNPAFAKVQVRPNRAVALLGPCALLLGTCTVTGTGRVPPFAA
jgi:hypothetical protein